jgi:ABC-type branched-subunit amino acid transport system substrate-binding protein
MPVSRPAARWPLAALRAAGYTLICALAIGALAGCAGPKVSERGRVTQPPRSAEAQRGPLVPQGSTPRVALLLPLTGNYAALGTAMNHAAEMALFDVAGKDFALMPLDTGGTPEGARAAAARAIADGAQLILGPLFATEVSAVRGEARRAHVNVVAFSTDASVAGDGVFLMGFLPRQQVERVVNYAISQGIKRFAVLAPETPYGQAVAADLQQIASAGGATVARSAFYGGGEQDITKTIRDFADYDRRHAAAMALRAPYEGKTDAESRREMNRLKKIDTVGDVDYDAVLIPEGGLRLILVGSLLPFFDVDPDKVRFLGTGQWDDPAVWREPTLRGSWFAAAAPSARQKFMARYKDAYGDTPPRIATLAYDAVALAAVLARGQNGPDFTNAALTTPNGFAGLDGIFRFQPDGLIQRGLAVLQVEPREPKVISPSPDSFETVTQ